MNEQLSPALGLHVHEERWRLALESSGLGVWDWDLRTGDEYYSNGLLGMYGYSEGELPSRVAAMDELTHPDDREQVDRDRRAHLQGHVPIYQNEHRMRCKDGRWKWVLTRGKVVSRDAQGRPLRMIGTHADITERKQAEALLQQQMRELADSEDKFSRVFHASPDWIVVSRLRDGILLDANHGFERISGFRREEVIGRSIRELNIWVDLEVREDMIRQLLQDGTVRDRRGRLRKRSGEIFQCVASATLVALEGQERDHAVWIARDVSEEMAATAKFVAAFELSPDFMSISRLSDGRLVAVNAAFERLTGVMRDEAVGKPSLELGIWNRPEQRERMLEHIARGEMNGEFELELRDREGRVHHGVGSGAVFDAHGERLLFALFRDVTEARRAEAALRESEARFASLFEDSPLPMSYAFDTGAFQTRHRNKAFYQTFCYARPGEPGVQVPRRGIWADAATMQEARRLRRKGQALDGWQVQVRRGDGVLRRVAVHSREIREPARRIIVTTLIDVTEQWEIEQQMQLLNEQLQQRVRERNQQLVSAERMAGLGTLTAGVAHEINNPTNFAHVAAQNLRLDLLEFERMVERLVEADEAPEIVQLFQERFARLHEHVATLLNGTERIKSIVRDLRAFTRLEQSEKSHVPVSSCLLSTLHLVRAAWQDKLSFHTELADDPSLSCWPALLSQVFMNLLVNACQAVVARHGAGGGGRIDIRARISGAQLQIAFQDNGVGISEALHSRVLEPFFTTKPVGEGTGLGLSISYGIVIQHGGDLRVQSTLGEGSCFTVCLPL